MKTVNVAETAANRFQAAWDRGAEWWAEHLRNDRNRRDQVFPAVLRMLGKPMGRRVLDAGSGEGTFARLLADAGASVTGVEFSRMIDLAVEEEERHARGIEYIKADLMALGEAFPLPREFDAAVCNLVLHCFPKPEPALRGIHAQLKPGGELVISELHPDTFHLFSRQWTACAAVEGNEYRYSLGPDCPEMPLFLHGRDYLESLFDRTGFSTLETFAPSAPAHSHPDVGMGLPQFVYYRLRKAC